MNPHKRKWIDETKMFQRIAGIPESSDEELGQDWDKFLSRKSKRDQKVSADNAEIQRSILQIGLDSK